MPSKIFAPLILWAAVLSPPAPTAVLERILAAVDERPIFLSDVKAVEALDQLPRKEALERLIDETLVYREAVRLPQALATAGSDTSEERTPGVDAPARRRAIERRGVIRRYADFRFRPQVRVEESELREVYSERFHGRADVPSLESVSAELREELTARAVSARVSAWVLDLRAQTRIRYNLID
jgi:hypothetical protein